MSLTHPGKLEELKRSTPFHQRECSGGTALSSQHSGRRFRTTLRDGRHRDLPMTANETATEPEVKVVINAGQFATSPPPILASGKS